MRGAYKPFLIGALVYCLGCGTEAPQIPPGDYRNSVVNPNDNLKNTTIHTEYYEKPTIKASAVNFQIQVPAGCRVEKTADGGIRVVKDEPSPAPSKGFMKTIGERLEEKVMGERSTSCEVKLNTPYFRKEFFVPKEKAERTQEAVHGIARIGNRQGKSYNALAQEMSGCGSYREGRIILDPDKVFELHKKYLTQDEQ